MTHIITPCRNLCSIDPNSQLCRGCYRRLDEIAEWRDLTPQERLAIMDQLASRHSLVQPT